MQHYRSFIIPRLAWRYLYGASHELAIKKLFILAFIALGLSSFALALTVSIMRGFAAATQKTMQGIHADLLIPYNDFLEAYPDLEKNIASCQGVASFSPNFYAHALLAQHNSEDPLGAVILMHGIDPEKEDRTTALTNCITEPKNESLSSLISQHKVLIGQQLGKEYAIQRGDAIRILYTPAQEITSNKLLIDQFELLVAGFIKTGIDEIDSTVLVCHWELFEELWPEQGPAHISIRLAPGEKMRTVAQRIQEKTELVAYSWQELYPSLLGALALQDLAARTIVMLMGLLASILVGCLIYLILISKRRDIALLRLMGVKTIKIRMIFLYMGILLSSAACTAGATLAYIVAQLIVYIKIPLPDIYITPYVPVDTNMVIFLSSGTFIAIISCGSVWLASKHVQSIQIGQTLRFE